jgi:hypothetical protein
LYRNEKKYCETGVGFAILYNYIKLVLIYG